MAVTAILDTEPDRRHLIGLAALGVAFIVIGAVMLRFLTSGDYERFVFAALAQGAFYVSAIWFVLRRKWGRAAWAVVIVVAMLARAISLWAPSNLSTDAYRYVWDGRVQAAGINPYRYVPSDNRLAQLRDDEIYANVDRRDYAPTIYPPAAQMIFFIVSRISETLTAMKLAMFGFDIVTMAAITALLILEGQPRERVLIYAWHPLPVWEFSGTGHIDAAAIAFMCLAMLAASSGRRVIAGAVLALGVLVKPFPLVLAPVLWRKWDWRMPTAVIATIALLYVPYLGVGWKVFGFLGGYGDEEGYLDGKGFFLVAFFRMLGFSSLSGPIFAALAFAILAGLALMIAFHPRRDEFESAAPIMLATSFLVLTSPHYAWYFAWVLPLLCRTVYVPLLYLTLAVFVFYLPQFLFTGDYFKAGLFLYGGFTILVVIDLMTRIKQSPFGSPR